jgi:hypothetical protein
MHPVLNCANGYQEENQQEVDEIEEDCGPESKTHEETSAEGKNP